MTDPRILVFGSTGQLAQHLRELLPDARYLSRAEADLTRPEQIAELIRSSAPSAVVNAAAYTAVDRAESERDIVWRVNCEATAAMARATSALDVPLIHISTDYVFDGQLERPYTEADPTAPINVYGATKLAGELAIAMLARKYWILRTSWVFSEFGTNFVKTMLRLGRERDTLRVVNDQIGRPTYAGDLARLIAALLAQPASPTLSYGIYHHGGGAVVSWHEFARRIFAKATELDMLARAPIVHGISTSEYPTPARRPRNSVLRPNPQLERQTGVQFDWSAGLERTLRRLSAGF